MGHATVMANVEFFCKTGQIQTNEEYPDMLKMDKLKLNSGNKKEGEVGNTKRDILNINISLFFFFLLFADQFNSSEDYGYMDALPLYSPPVFALLVFEKPIIAPLGSIVIASRLDIDIRIFFSFCFFISFSFLTDI